MPPSASWNWAFAGALLGLLYATVVFAPAQWLAVALYQASDGRVSLANASGSVWDGSAQLVLSGGAGSEKSTALPGALNWHIRPVWAGLSVKIDADCCTQQALQVQALATGWGSVRVQVEDGQSHWPAGLLAGLGTPWNTVQAQGQINAATQGWQMDWNQGRLNLSGRLQLDALHVSSRLSTISPMGSYRFTLLGGTTPSLQLETLEGSLQLSGQGQWVGQHLRFTGVASAAPERVEALSNLLNILGRRDGARSIITVG
jgi:general secretion pathway protein N